MAKQPRTLDLSAKARALLARFGLTPEARAKYDAAQSDKNG
jgi:hypothetical protein